MQIWHQVCSQTSIGFTNPTCLPVSLLCLGKWYLPSQSCTNMDLFCGGFSKPVVWPFPLDIKDLRFQHDSPPAGCKSCHCGSPLTANLRLFQCSCGRFSSAISLFQLKKAPLNTPHSNSTYRVRDPWLVSPDILHPFFHPFKAPRQVQGLEYLFYEGRLQELVLFSLKTEKRSH